MTHGDGETARSGESGPRRGHAWTAGLARLAEELEAFSGRLLEAQRALSAPPSAQAPPSGPSAEAPRPPPSGSAALHERLDATERLVTELEARRRRDGAARVLALTDAARRLDHVQQVIELSQRRLAAVDDPSISLAQEPPPPPPPPQGVPPERLERAVLRVEEFESRMAVWEQELGRQAALLERVAHSCQELEADLATRDEIELHIATLIERVSRSIARAPVLQHDRR